MSDTSMMDLNRRLHQTLKAMLGLPDRVRKLTLTMEANKPAMVSLEYYAREHQDTVLKTGEFQVTLTGSSTTESLNVGDECSTLDSRYKQFVAAPGDAA